MTTKDTTDFGYAEIPAAEKQARVRKVFDSVASRYDLMNDLMSLGTHRLWKRFVVDLMALREGHQVLDVAGGTGDLAMRYVGKVGDSGRVVLSDINGAMLAVGRDRFFDKGLSGNVEFVEANAECLPFPAHSFDRVSIAFGLRNVTDKDAALRSMFDTLRPGGRLLVLEFSTVVIPSLRALYDTWSFKVLPRLGKFIADDAASYQYLAESIRRFPDQVTLKGMLQEAGFERCEYFNLSGGIVAVHSGWKL